jgi:hypothetical protein
MSEAEVMRDKALRVLRAAVEEARGEPGTYVSRARVMEQTKITNLGEFSKIAHYLAGQGLIAEGVNDYEFFVLTLGGIAAGAKY